MSASTPHVKKRMSFLDLKERGRNLQMEKNFTHAIGFYLKAYEMRSIQLRQQQKDHINLLATLIKMH
jgi:hypothetical protein